VQSSKHRGWWGGGQSGKVSVSEKKPEKKGSGKLLVKVASGKSPIPIPGYSKEGTGPP